MSNLTMVGAGAAGGAFNPGAIAGLQAWCKADSLVLSDSDPVGTWADQSGNGRDWTQATAAAKPTYKTGIVNGKPVVRFDAVDDGMAGAYIRSSPDPFTVFAVYAYRSAASAGRRAIAGGDGNWLMGPYNNKHEVFAGTFTPGSPAVAQNVFVYHVATQNTSTTINYVNGVQFGSITTPGTFPGHIALGGSNPFGEPADCDIAEVLVYDTVLSTANRQALEVYLAAKYGL